MITFDGVNKLMIVSGVTLDAIGLYSDWKEWVNAGNAGYLAAFKVVGGDPIGSGEYITPYVFLQNGWRVRPQESDHRLIVTGALLTDDGESPFVDTVGTYQVRIEQQVPIKAATVEIGSGLDLAESSMLAELHAAHFNRRTRTSNVITLYAEDGETPIAVFDTDTNLSQIVPR